jgi:heterodisulfide reductase subunit E
MIINQALLWVILGVCFLTFCLGFIYRMSIWLRGKDKNGSGERSRTARFFSYLGLFLRTLFSRKSGQLIKSFFADGIVHGNLFRDSILKWFIHIFMFWGLASFTLISILHLIAIAAAPGNTVDAASPWYMMVFGTLENRFTAIIMDLSKLAILGGAFIAVIRFLFLKSKYKSVELKDKSAGIIISFIAILSFFYEGTFFLVMETQAARAAFAPAGYVLSLILGLIPGINWVPAATGFFYASIVLLLLFVALIPFGRYSHMVFGPIVAVYNKMTGKNH